MELQIRDNFIPNKGIGDLLFLDDENIIKEKIGIPDFEKIDTNDIRDYTINISYKSLGLDCFIHYEDLKFSYTSFHLQNIIIDDMSLDNMGQDDCIIFFKKYHSNRSIKYLVDKKRDAEETIYFFENIGLTLWFSKDELSDISIEPIWE